MPLWVRIPPSSKIFGVRGPMAVNCLENRPSLLCSGTEFDSLALLHIWKMPLNGGQSGSNPEDAARRGVRFALLPPSPVSVRVALWFETPAGVVRLHDSGPILFALELGTAP